MLVNLLICLLIIAAFFLLVMVYDCHRFVTITYEVKSEKVTKEYTFALLSDLHNKSYGRENEKLLQAIDKCSPDAVLMAGDMITAQKNGNYQTALHLIEKLTQKYPVYYGMGNHEEKTRQYPEYFGNLYTAYQEKLRECNAEPLSNESVEIPAYNIRICGLNLDRCYYKKIRKYPLRDAYLKETLGEPKKDKFQILIAHNPEYFAEYADWGADLVVSGHVHGGLMRLPYFGGVVSPKLTLFPKYDGGRFKEKNSEMILSRGLGTHTLPIRIFNPGELIMIHLSPEDKIQ